MGVIGPVLLAVALFCWYKMGVRTIRVVYFQFRKYPYIFEMEEYEEALYLIKNGAENIWEQKFLHRDSAFIKYSVSL